MWIFFSERDHDQLLWYGFALGNPLTSEENYEAENAANWNNVNYSSGYPNYADVKNIQTYLGGTFPNPYNYGYIVEITQPAETPVPVKHFVWGALRMRTW